MKNTHNRILDFGKKLTNVENKTQTLYDLEYGEKTEKLEK
jgi:hypothetical protein